MGFLDMVENTVKGLGDSVWTVPGAALDLGHAVLDGPGGFTVADALDSMSGRLGGAADLLVDNGTLSGFALQKLAAGYEKVYHEGVAQPLATAGTVIGHAQHDRDVTSLFSGETWGEAYRIAEERTPGQAMTLMLAQGAGAPEGSSLAGKGPFGNNAPDPLEQTAWEEFAEQSPFMASMVSGSVDFGIRIVGDPGIVGGKLFSAYRRATVFRPVTEAEANTPGAITQLMREQEKARVSLTGAPIFREFTFESKRAGLKTRTDAYLGHVDDAGVYHPGFIEGKNAWQIYRSTPELSRSAYGGQLAGLLGRANKVLADEPAKRLNVQRDILAASYGDVTAVKRLREADGEIADQLSNIFTGTTVPVRQMDAAEWQQPTLFMGAEPTVIAETNRQLDNLVDLPKWLEASQRITLHVGAAGKRGEARLNQQGLLRSGQLKTGYDSIDESVVGKGLSNVIGRPFAAAEDFFQASPESMPLRVVHTVPGLLWKTSLGGVGKLGYGASNKMRAMAVPGWVNLNQPEETARALDTMMVTAGVEDGTRWRLLSEMFTASDKTAREVTTQVVERASVSALARKHNIEPDMMEAIFERAAARRGKMVTALRGRVYTTSDDVTRMMTDDGTRLRADQIDHDGIPTSVPFVDSQIANTMPLMDINLMDKELARSQSYLSKLSRQWKELQREPGKVWAGERLDDVLESRRQMADTIIGAGEAAMRTWKFSVLARLGYPLRVMTDDHMRIAAQGHSLSVYATLAGEGFKNRGRNTLAMWGNHKRALELKHEATIIEDFLGDDALRAASLEVAKQVKALNRKITRLQKRGEVKPGQIDALTSQRDALQAQGFMDVEDAQARLAQIDDMLRNKEFRAPKATLASGQRQSAGVTVPDAFAGEGGRQAKQINQTGALMDESIENMEHISHSMTRNSAEWRTILPEEAVHGQAWEYAINFHIRQSELAQIVLKGGTADDIVHFLRAEQRGREIAKAMPYHAADPERWAANIEAMVHKYLPSEELMATAAKGRVTKAQLERAFADPTDRPAVHGAGVGLNIGTGHVSSMLNRGMARMYRYIGELPSAHLARHPLYVTFYRDEQDRLMKRLAQQAKDEGRTPTLDEVNHAAKQARMQAGRDVNNLLFDVSAKSSAAAHMRFVSPFFAAWQETMRRWGRIITDKPQVLRQLQLAFDMPRKLGLVVDENGEPVPAGAPIESNHYILMQLPHAWGGPDPTKGFTGTGKKISEGSINLILQGGGILNPGFGPLIQVPASMAATNLADREKTARLLKAVNPWGPAAWDAGLLQPATFKRLHTVLSHELSGSKNAEWLHMQNTIIQEKMVEFNENHHRPPNPAEQRKIIEAAEDETRSLAWWRVANNAFSPFPVQYESKYAWYEKAYRKLRTQQEDENREYGWADETFRKLYGETFFPLTRSASNNESGLDPTAATVASVKRHRGLLKQVDPRLYKMVVGPEGDGAFSIEAYRFFQKTVIDPGSGNPIIDSDDPAVAMEQNAAAMGWTDYNKLTSGLMAEAYRRGLTSYTEDEELVAVKRQAVAALAQENPSWWEAFNSFNAGEFDTLVSQMETVANDKSLLSDPARPEVRLLGTYLKARQMVKTQLQMRSLQGGSASIDAQDNADLAAMFVRTVDSLNEASSYFEDYFYNGIIERDPLYVPETVIAA